MKFEQHYLHDPERDFGRDSLQNEEMSSTKRVINGTATGLSLPDDTNAKLKKTSCERIKKEHEKQPIFDKVNLHKYPSNFNSVRVEIKEIKSPENWIVSVVDEKLSIDEKSAREISESKKSVDSECANFERFDLHNHLSVSEPVLSSEMYNPVLPSIKASAVNGKTSCQESPRRYFSATFPRNVETRTVISPRRKVQQQM